METAQRQKKQTTKKPSRKFGIDIKDSMEIYTEDNCIILKKYEPSCIFCGDAKNIFQFNGKNICPECAKKINGYVAE